MALCGTKKMKPIRLQPNEYTVVLYNEACKNYQTDIFEMTDLNNIHKITEYLDFQWFFIVWLLKIRCAGEK